MSSCGNRRQDSRPSPIGRVQARNQRRSALVSSLLNEIIRRRLRQVCPMHQPVPQRGLLEKPDPREQGRIDRSCVGHRAADAGGPLPHNGLIEQFRLNSMTHNAIGPAHPSAAQGEELMVEVRIRHITDRCKFLAKRLIEVDAAPQHPRSNPERPASALLFRVDRRILIPSQQLSCY